MAHFSKLGIGNVVEQVVVVSDDIATTEQAGIDFLNNLYNTPHGVWRQTSYNTRAGEHKLGGTPFRKNYGSIGFIYDETNKAFYPPQPYPSWQLNTDTFLWEAPVAEPVLTEEQLSNGVRNYWNDNKQIWETTD
tara:strand:+ start:108 stop:509 length:402 start_codon:yes stop_codon:yes gene_type:complete